MSLVFFCSLMAEFICEAKLKLVLSVMEYFTPKPSPQGKAEIDSFPKNCVNSGLTFEDIKPNKMIEHVGRETIEVQQLPNNFKLSVKVFIAGRG